jgi:hypothetical protein
MLTGRVSQAGSETGFHSGKIRRRCSRVDSQPRGLISHFSYCTFPGPGRRQIWTEVTARQSPFIPTVGLSKYRGRRRIGIDVIGLAGPAKLSKIPLPKISVYITRRVGSDHGDTVAGVHAILTLGLSPAYMRRSRRHIRDIHAGAHAGAYAGAHAEAVVGVHAET